MTEAQLIFEDKMENLMKMALKSELQTPCLDKAIECFSIEEILIIKKSANDVNINQVAFPNGGDVDIKLVESL